MCIYIYTHTNGKGVVAYIYIMNGYIYEYIYDTSFLSIHLVKGC